MCDGIVPICVDAPAEPDDCFGIGTELRLGKSDPYHDGLREQIFGAQ
jgi:hypothetical protein